MIYTDVNYCDPIILGRQGENKARAVRFPVASWWEELGAGTFSLLHQRHGDAAPYPCVITQDGAYVVWVLTNADLIEGYGKCQLIFTVGDVVAKDVILDTYTGPALTGGTEPPEPYEDWVQRVLEAGTQAQEAAESASEEATRAESAADNAEQSAESAQEAAQTAATETAELIREEMQGYVSDAAAAKEAAETAQSASETAQAAAETAKTAAQSAASTAASNAFFAGQSAEDASQAKVSAQYSAADAAAAKEAAQTAATTATTQATAAAGSATSAAGSAATASTKAGEAATSATNANTAKVAAQSAQSAAEEARDEAQQYAEAIEDLTATAHQVAAGGTPTVTKTGGTGGTPYNLDFGIPKGDPGPNTVSTATATDITGLLKGSGGHVVQAIPGTDYLVPPTIETAADIKAALDAGLDLTDLVGEQITCAKGSGTLIWDVADYNSVNHEVTLLLHDTLPDQLPFEQKQALAYFADGLAAGDYSFIDGSSTYYFTLTHSIPEGGQLRATTTDFYTYASQDSTSALESGTVSTTQIAGAISLGTTGTGDLNRMERVNYGSNNIKEASLQWWLNTDAPAGTLVPRINKFSLAYSYNVAGFLNGLDPEFLACIADTDWKCATNQTYEAPASMGGTVPKSTPYTINAKFCLASRKEIFGDSDGTADGSTQFDLFVGSTADDRKKYYDGSVRSWWLRSPLPSNSYNERYTKTDGSVNFAGAYGGAGVVPVCKIRKAAT